ncbi:MAG: hypothetical protein J6336_02630 [Kiritimatiellae bacterium]|nr:hypothetical protein [Kiritimatiellia bacterium]
MKGWLGIFFGLGIIRTLCGAEIVVETTRFNGEVSRETRPLAFQDGHAQFRIPQTAIAPDTKSIALKADFAQADKGEEGYFVFPNGHLGFFREEKGFKNLDAPPMPIFGMKTPRGCFVAIVTGMPYNYAQQLSVQNGHYSLYPLFKRAIHAPYEDIVIDYYQLSGADADYAGMARRYRRHQLDTGTVIPLRERAKKSKELAYAANYPEVRVRHGWKPVPSPVPEQTVKDEPPMKAVITFDRFMAIVDEFARQGIPGAEFCLVGWNQKGHDGRWPQIFPVEESLGGEAKLREAIRHAQEKGYQVVAHGNHRDAYMIADCWDAEYIMEKKDGILQRGKTTWGGGRMYTICPQRAYERFAIKDTAMIAALGFRGLHYLDVFSCVPAPRCTDPRHPLNEREAAKYIGAIMQLGRETFGGCASEGAYDHFVGQLDSVLYVSFDKPFSPMPDLVHRRIPIFQLVYHGIILSTPFTTTVNAPIKSRADQLKLVEFGGRPTFYYYSIFLSSGKNWMGDEDLTCATDEELRKSVEVIKRGTDAYRPLADLQYAFMDGHEEVQPDLFKTVYSDGTVILSNYRKEPVTVDGTTIPAEDYAVIGRQTNGGNK